MDSTIIASIIGAVAVIIAAALPHYLKHGNHGKAAPKKSVASPQINKASEKELKTWAGQSQFSYSGSVKEGTRIIIGNSKQVSEITAEQYQELISHFSGQTLKVGSVQSSSYEEGTLDAWLKKNVTKRMVATYVASILKHESYATNTKGKIEFNA